MAIDSTILAKIKLALRITDNDFDGEISDLADAALADLGIAGVDGANAVITDPLVLRAVITYCKVNFGEPDDAERLKKSYDEQKAQMGTATGWTVWPEEV